VLRLAREPPPTMLEKLAYGAPNGAGWIRRGENSGRCYVSLSPAAPGGYAPQTQRWSQPQVTADGLRPSLLTDRNVVQPSARARRHRARHEHAAPFIGMAITRCGINFACLMLA
jgi:hypothetical protein